MSYLTQVAESIIPDLEYLERLHRSKGNDWTADQLAGRIYSLNEAIKDEIMACKKKPKPPKK